MKHPAPASPELGVHEGLAYGLFVPSEPPPAGVVVMHGALSEKESHYDFGRACQAAGLAAVVFDARGNGESPGEFGPGAIDDALAMADLVRSYAPRVALRGSSMGAWRAIHAAARDHSICAVVAVCPAPDELLAAGLRSGRLEGFGWDRETALPFLDSLSIFEAVAAFGPDTALMLQHARGDEDVPVEVSERLYEVAHEPKRLVVVPGGTHRSAQHDAELQGVSLRWIADAAAGRASASN